MGDVCVFRVYAFMTFSKGINYKSQRNPGVEAVSATPKCTSQGHRNLRNTSYLRMPAPRGQGPTCPNHGLQARRSLMQVLFCFKDDTFFQGRKRAVSHCSLSPAKGIPGNMSLSLKALESLE